MKANVRSLAGLLIPLLALWLLVRHFTVETPAFANLVLVAIAGLPVHYFLPASLRLGFFLALSVAGFVVVLGLVPTAWLLAIGLVLIGFCHLPVAFRWRVAILVAAGGMLMAFRGGLAHVPVPAAVWPILGSIFMFRLAVYLYDIRHDPALGSPIPSLAYFFILPNVCFPLFPVIDYKTFRRTYYNQERHAIYDVGLKWIFRGVVHLLLYRLVYLTLVIEPRQVSNVVELGQYMIWPFLLYLRISGQFHLVVGMLRLYGFNLPETHKEYFLTSSFTDFWRRINIYWKDFMMKLVYYPTYFALKKRTPVVAIGVSTAVVFAATWLLHSYQWFWLRGSFLFAWHDALFWALLGGLVIANSLHEWRHGRARTLTPQTLTWPDTLALAARTMGMFSLLCLLWSLWSTESVATWLSLWEAAGEWPASVTWASVVTLSAPFVVAVAVVAKSRRWLTMRPVGAELRGAVAVLTCAVLFLSSYDPVSAHMGSAGRFMTTLRHGGLNTADAIAEERGYYENLLGVANFNTELWALYRNRPADWGGNLVAQGLARETVSPFPIELVPSASGRFAGATFRTNAMGLHDQEYSKQPPAGCQRLALLGASTAMGTGVRREETFEALVESRLAREGVCVEILNLAVWGYSPLNQLAVLEMKALPLSPTAFIYVAHPGDRLRAVRALTKQVRREDALPHGFMKDIVEEAQVDSRMPERVIEQRLTPFGDRALARLYSEMMAVAARHGLGAGLMFLPMPDATYATSSTEHQRERQLAEEAGFAMLDLTGVFDGMDLNTLSIAEWDRHPNVLGHEIIAGRLHSWLMQQPALLHHGQPLAPEQARGPR